MADSNTPYVPSQWGQFLHSVTNPDGSQIDEILGAGSAGPGKTQALLHEPFAQILVEHQRCSDLMHPHPLKWGDSTGHALFMRRELAMMSQTIERAHKSFTPLDPQLKWSEKHLTFTFASGYKYKFGHCKDSGDWLRYYSDEYTIILWDELIQFEQEQYQQINSRLRSSDPVLRTMLKVRACSNPVRRSDSNTQFAGSDPNWVRKYFVDPAPQGKVIIRKPLKMSSGKTEYHTRMYLPARLDDNPNMEFRQDYERKLRILPPHIQKALLEGDWYINPDSYFGHVWNSQVHVVRPFKIPSGWKWFRSMDWGYKKPGCVHWWAMSDEEELFCVREWMFQGKLVEEVALAIVDMEVKMGLEPHAKRSLLTGPADNQLWEQRGDRIITKAEIMSKAGVEWVQADKRNRRRNAELLMARLAASCEPMQAGVYFFAGCSRIVQNIVAIQTDRKDPECPADGGDDHAFDSACYGVAYAQNGSAGIHMELSSKERRERKEQENDEATGWGRWGYGAEV